MASGTGGISSPSIPGVTANPDVRPIQATLKRDALKIGNSRRRSGYDVELSAMLANELTIIWR